MTDLTDAQTFVTSSPKDFRRLSLAWYRDWWRGVTIESIRAAVDSLGPPPPPLPRIFVDNNGYLSDPEKRQIRRVGEDEYICSKAWAEALREQKPDLAEQLLNRPLRIQFPHIPLMPWSVR